MLPVLIAAGLAALLLILFLARPRAFLNPDKYKPAKLIEKQTITHNTKRFRFALPAGGKLGLPIGQHISFSFTDADGKMVMRSYTPVTGDEATGFVDFVIKVYPQGKMSQHVDSLKINDTILMKGPKGQFKYTANMKSAIGTKSPPS
jgi:cytochrome-b5 reductase